VFFGLGWVGVVVVGVVVLLLVGVVVVLLVVIVFLQTKIRKFGLLK
jgi:hypothetical protein